MRFKTYIQDNEKRFLEELFDLIKIPSVSALTEHNKDIRTAANFLLNQFNKLGLDNCEICETKGYPIVYAEKIINKEWNHMGLSSKGDPIHEIWVNRK